MVHESGSMTSARRRLYYSGSVQGVGFRQTTVRLARGHAVAGFVRNLPDGRVELVAEGEISVLSAFLEGVQDHLGEYIRDVESTSPPIDEPPFSGFTIRFN